MKIEKHAFYGAEGRYVAEAEFDRILAERNALQQRLNVVEEENDRLRTLVKNSLAEILLIEEVVGSTRQIRQLVSDMKITLENRS